MTARKQPRDHEPTLAQKAHVRQQILQEAQAVIDEAIVDERPTVQFPEKPKNHTILEVWSSVLDAIEDARDSRITVSKAAQLVATYPFLSFEDLPAYMEAYYDYLVQYRSLLREEIASDDKALTWTEPDDDAEQNRHHYLNLMVGWQRLALHLRSEWEVGAFAGIKLAALNDTQQFMLGERGIINLLGQIKFSYDDDDANEIYALAVEGYEQEG